MRHQIPFFLRFGRGENFPDAFSKGRMAANEHRHVGAELQTQRRQLIFRKITAPQVIQRHQYGGRVGRAAAEAAAHRQHLINADIGAAACRKLPVLRCGLH